jgi:tRNA(fMet)-specific endonuclease VapC
MYKSHPLLTKYRPHLDGYSLAISFQTLAELLECAALAGWGIGKRRALAHLLSTLLVLDSDTTVCEKWAEIRAVRKPQPIPVADCWIAATAVAYGLELVTHNPADFAGIPWLTVIAEGP